MRELLIVWAMGIPALGLAALLSGARFRAIAIVLLWPVVCGALAALGLVCFLAFLCAIAEDLLP